MVLAENDYPPEIVAALEALRASLPDGPVPALNEAAPDAVFWARELAAFPGGTWRDLSWFVAESYFYRCILDAVDYFVPGPWQGRDPYALQKQAALVEGLAAWPTTIGVSWICSGGALSPGVATLLVGQSRRSLQYQGGSRRGRRVGRRCRVVAIDILPPCGRW
jgi:hypothetical protein